MIEDLKTDFERAEYLQNLLISHATGGAANEGDYMHLRRHFLDQQSTGDLVPRFVRTNRDLSQFWQFIKAKFNNYAGRRQFIWDEFRPLLEYLERGGTPPSARMISETLQKFDAENVHAAWAKALERSTSDPDGAVTAARTLLETVCKHILEESKEEYGKNPNLPELYSLVAKRLRLSPTQHTEKAFRQILQGCSSVVDGLASIRNKLGDAHGQGKGGVRPKTRHAALAVNLAGAMAVFLVETWESRKDDQIIASTVQEPTERLPAGEA
ncbi:MAG TPA: abortive infection family protein [Thermoguttaceae bacterium]